MTLQRHSHWAAPVTLLAALAAGATLLCLGEPAHAAAAEVLPPVQTLPLLEATMLSILSILSTTVTHPPLHQRLLEPARAHFGGDCSLRELDARTLADIGVTASEIESIEAEAHGSAALTRRRIVAGLQRA